MRHSGRMPANQTSLIRAEAIGVLGEYDHRLEFPVDQDFAIVYGPNGVGKTKFLEIIHALIRLDGRVLSRMPFERAKLEFADDTIVGVGPAEVSSAHVGEKRRDRRNIQFHLRTRGRDSEPWQYTGDNLEDWLLENSSWRPYDDVLWQDYRDGEIASLDDLEQRYPDSAAGLASTAPTDFRVFRRRMKSYLIETQRLRIENFAERHQGARFGAGRSPSRKHGSKITQHAGKMRTLVNEAQTEHSTVTQQLDRTFPNRVLEGSTASIDADQVRKRYEDQNIFRSRLGRVASVALAEALSLPDRELDDWELRLLNLYLDDAEQKLAPFEILLQKIELLEEIVNTRLLRKKLRVTAKDGLLVQHDPEDRPIDLDSLSSGEQHEIILMFDLLFKVPEGALVMIDEPEISLHVVWQLAFIPDVKRIAELANFRFIVATHSPQIINDAWDRAVALGPEEEPFV